jgi:hypothetical protein
MTNRLCSTVTTCGTRNKTAPYASAVSSVSGQSAADFHIKPLVRIGRQLGCLDLPHRMERSVVLHERNDLEDAPSSAVAV